MNITISRIEKFTAVLLFCYLLCLGCSPILAQLTFQPISDTNISPPGTKAARPDTALLSDRFYVAYLQLSPIRTFRLLVLNKDLTQSATTDLFSGNDEPTDIRIHAGYDDSFYYAFETTRFRKEFPNHLNVAYYEVTGSLPTLAISKTEIAAAMPVIIPDSLPKPGDDLLDDPTPLVYRGRFYVLTRKWESATVTIREFSRDLSHMKTHNLDFGGTFPGLHLSVNSLVNIEGKPYLITGVKNGPPIDRRFFAYVAAVELDETMTKPGRPIVLSRTQQYDDYVASARYSRGMLFVGYDSRDYDQPKPGPSNHCGWIKVFDPDSEFAPLGSIQVNSSRMIDNHFTFEVLDDKLYVFYQTPQEEIRLKVIALKGNHL